MILLSLCVAYKIFINSPTTDNGYSLVPDVMHFALNLYFMREAPVKLGKLWKRVDIAKLL